AVDAGLTGPVRVHTTTITTTTMATATRTTTTIRCNERRPSLRKRTSEPGQIGTARATWPAVVADLHLGGGPGDGLSGAEVGRLDSGVGGDDGGGAGGGDGAGVEDVGAVGDLEGHAGQLLDEEDGGALGGELADDREHVG